jgi:hypothetical protein
MATQVDLGKIRPVWKGDWTSSTAYEQNDMIRHGVNSYICVTAHTSAGSFSDANWNVIAYGAELPAQSGNSGNFLQTDGSSLSWTSASAGLKSMQTFANAASAGGTYTWTRPSGITTVKVYVVGGGGGAQNVSSNQIGTGGSGGLSIAVIDVSSISSVTVTLGNGGGGTNNSTRAGSGGTSSFGSYASATGGEGGVSTNSPYDGGIGGIGTTSVGGAVNSAINVRGNGGQRNGGNNVQISGGASFFGGSGVGAHDTGSTPTQGQHGTYGGGGGGSQYTAVVNGGAGVVVVEEYA